MLSKKNTTMTAILKKDSSNHAISWSIYAIYIYSISIILTQVKSHMFFKIQLDFKFYNLLFKQFNKFQSTIPT